MKAYLIVDITVVDSDSFSDYLTRIPEFVNKHSGNYLVKGGEPSSIEGDWKPEKVVIIEFPSRKDAEGFLQDPGSQLLFNIRHKATVSKMILVNGCYE